MSYKRAPAWPWVGTIIQREDMKLFFQEFRVSILLIKKKIIEQRIYLFLYSWHTLNIGTFATHLKRLKD